MSNNIIIATVILCAFFTACKKTNGPNDSETKLAPLSIEFDNIVSGQNLILGNEMNYRNSSGENFSISLIQYYISNIKVKRTDGTEYTVPQDSSYFLIKENDPSARAAEVNVPEGEYSSLTFTLGVDSLRSTMDIEKRKGVLEPSGEMENSMYWGWNSGYIFFKMEGLSDKAPEDPGGQHKFRYHIGGFGGYSAPTINNIKTVTLDLSAGGIVKVRAGRESNVHLMVDLSKVFDGISTIKIEENPTVMFSAFSVNIANNLPAMFRHDHTEN